MKTSNRRALGRPIALALFVVASAKPMTRAAEPVDCELRYQRLTVNAKACR